MEENFDENTRRRRCVSIIDLNAFEGRPGQGIRKEQMREQTRHIAKHVIVVAMDSLVSFHKQLLKLRLILTIEHTETLSNKTVELEVSTLLRTTLDDHLANVFTRFDLAITINNKFVGLGYQNKSCINQCKDQKIVIDVLTKWGIERRLKRTSILRSLCTTSS